MQSRRVFLINSAANLTAFATGGTLTMFGKKELKQAVQDEPAEVINDQKQSSKSENPRTVFANNAADFTLGGTLGILIKKVIEKSISLKRLNRDLSSVISKLQNLEKNDLPAIENALQIFVRSEGINELPVSDDTVKSIQGLINAISIHVSSQSRAIQPFLVELQKLRVAMTQPFIEQLQSGGDINTATKGAVFEALRSNKLTEYLETTIVNALHNTGAGERIGKNTVESISKKDLVDEDGYVALRQTVTGILKGEEFTKAMSYATASAVTEYGIVDKLADALSDEFKVSLKDNEAAMTALKEALNKALGSNNVSATLAEEFVSNLQRALHERSKSNLHSKVKSDV